MSISPPAEKENETTICYSQDKKAKKSKKIKASTKQPRWEDQTLSGLEGDIIIIL